LFDRSLGVILNYIKQSSITMPQATGLSKLSLTGGLNMSISTKVVAVSKGARKRKKELTPGTGKMISMLRVMMNVAAEPAQYPAMVLCL
jgi:hypothetical protein